MTVFTTKELRSQMGLFIELLLKGEDVELNYRSKKLVVTNKDAKVKTKGNFKKAISRLRKYKIDPKYQEAKDFKEIMDKYYE
jgi:hypothetical protein